MCCGKDLKIRFGNVAASFSVLPISSTALFGGCSFLLNTATDGNKKRAMYGLYIKVGNFYRLRLLKKWVLTVVFTV